MHASFSRQPVESQAIEILLAGIEHIESKSHLQGADLGTCVCTAERESERAQGRE